MGRPNLALSLLRRRQSKRLLLNGFTNGTTADALCADFHRLHATVGGRCTDLLQVRAKLTTSLASDFGTDATEVFSFTARFD